MTKYLPFLYLVLGLLLVYGPAWHWQRQAKRKAAHTFNRARGSELSHLHMMVNGRPLWVDPNTGTMRAQENTRDAA